MEQLKQQHVTASVTALTERQLIQSLMKTLNTSVAHDSGFVDSDPPEAISTQF